MPVALPSVPMGSSLPQETVPANFGSGIGKRARIIEHSKSMKVYALMWTGIQWRAQRLLPVAGTE